MSILEFVAGVECRPETEVSKPGALMPDVKCHSMPIDCHTVSITSSPLVMVVSFLLLLRKPTLKICSLINFFSPSHLFASTLRSVPARIMTCQCLRSSAISVVIWFLAMSSFTMSRHLSFGLPRFLFLSPVICNIFLVASSLSPLCTCPNHLNLFTLKNSAIGYMCASFQMSTLLT